MGVGLRVLDVEGNPIVFLSVTLANWQDKCALSVVLFGRQGVEGPADIKKKVFLYRSEGGRSEGGMEGDRGTYPLHTSRRLSVPGFMYSCIACGSVDPNRCHLWTWDPRGESSPPAVMAG